MSSSTVLPDEKKWRKDASMNYLQSAATIPLHNFLFTYSGPLLITLRDKGNSYSWQFRPAISFNLKWISNLLKCTLVEYLLTDMDCKWGPIHMHCLHYPHSFPSPTFTLSARKVEWVTLLITFHQLSTWTIFICDLWYSVLFYDIDVIGVHVSPKFLLASFNIDITQPFLPCSTVQ